MRKLLFLILAPILAQYVHSQHIINVNGRYADNGNLSISYSIGDISIATFHNDKYIVGQGFIINKFQDIYSLPVRIEDNFMLDSINLYPNPVVDFLTIESNTPDLKYRLINVYGVTMSQGTLSNNKAVISVKYYPQSAYILQLSENNKPIKSYTIIKK